MSSANSETPAGNERQQMEVDIACVGFGPAMGGFLITLSRNLLNADGTPRFESDTLPGAPLQVICYERADGLGFGVSGVASRARGIRESFPELAPSQIPMAVPVKTEKLVYLLDPGKASRRSLVLRMKDQVIRALGPLVRFRNEAVELPYHSRIPPETRWFGAVDWPVQPMGGRAIEFVRPGADLAGNAGKRSVDRERRSERSAADGSRH